MPCTLTTTVYLRFLPPASGMSWKRTVWAWASYTGVASAWSYGAPGALGLGGHTGLDKGGARRELEEQAGLVERLGRGVLGLPIGVGQHQRVAHHGAGPRLGVGRNRHSLAAGLARQRHAVGGAGGLI